MPAIPPRRLNLLDGMLLVAGVATGLMLIRQHFRDSYVDFAARLVPSSWGAAEGTRVALIGLATLSPILLAIRLRRPRPRRARLFAQPGTVASLAGSCVATAGVLTWAGLYALSDLDLGADLGSPRRVGSYLDEMVCMRIIAHGGWAVAIGWITLGLGRRWRAERGAIDRAGRLVGACWIATAVAIGHADVRQGIGQARSHITSAASLRQSDKLLQQFREQLRQIDESFLELNKGARSKTTNP